jgi:hypothetical protein
MPNRTNGQRKSQAQVTRRVQQTSLSQTAFASANLLQRAQVDPNSLSASDVKVLQRSLGNRASIRLLAPVLQAKLNANPGHPNPALATQIASTPRVQRDPDDDADEDVSWTKKHNIDNKKDAHRFDNKVKNQSAMAEQVRIQGEIPMLALSNMFTLWGGTEPSKAKKALGKGFPKGPMIKDADVKTIKMLSKTPTGVEWLHSAGLFTYNDAMEYLVKHDFLDWQLLHRSSKMFLAYLAWHEMHDTMQGTPPYWVARSILANEDDQLKQEIDDDLQSEWLKTLEIDELNTAATSAIQQGAVPNPVKKTFALNQKKNLSVGDVRTRHAHATEVLRKVLVILQAGLEVYNTETGKYEIPKEPVIKALSHGGRVNIRIPQLKGQQKTGKINKKLGRQKRSDDSYRSRELSDWLGITDNGEVNSEKGIFTRSFGTHFVAVGKDKKNKQGTFKENGGQWAAAQGKAHKDVQLYGMNIAAGGIGQKDFNGDIILPDGAHGHMFIGYRRPTLDKDGYLQIGIETTGPHAPSTVGYIHDVTSSEKTANPISSFGGLKKDKIGDGNDNARTVDLGKLGDDWLDKLNQIEADFMNDDGTYDYQRLVGARAVNDNSGEESDTFVASNTEESDTFVASSTEESDELIESSSQ